MPGNDIDPILNMTTHETVESSSSTSSSSSSVEELVRDILILKLMRLVDASKEDTETLNAMYGQIDVLSELVAKINAMTDKDGKVKVDDELFSMLNAVLTSDDLTDQQNDLKMSPDSLNILEVGKTYKSDDRQRLLENLNMKIKSLTTKTETKFLDLSQGYSEKLEAQQVGRQIINNLDNMMKSLLRGIAGR
ncbi:MAG: hypothetical protein VX777_02110 [Chlamydiota bacterium]|nr:hypothetical protein [Chlamydiota bacterium]